MTGFCHREHHRGTRSGLDGMACHTPRAYGLLPFCMWHFRDPDTVMGHRAVIARVYDCVCLCQRASTRQHAHTCSRTSKALTCRSDAKLLGANVKMISHRIRRSRLDSLLHFNFSFHDSLRGIEPLVSLMFLLQ